MDLVDPSSSDQEFSALTDLPLFLGYISSYLLQGILIVQIFIYYVAFPRDPLYMKITVAFLFFVECLSSFFATYAALWSIVEFGDLFDLASLWGFKALGPLCGVAALTVHSFYAWRIHLVKGHWSISLLVILLSIAQCFTVIWTGTQSYLGIGEDHPTEIIFVAVWLAGSALCDIIIAVSLVILLGGASRSLSTGSDKATRLERLMKVVVETGMITAFGALFELLFFFLFRNSLIHYILFYMLPKVYSNCMMAALNARISARALRQRDPESTSQQSAELPFAHETRRYSNLSTKDSVLYIVAEDGKMVSVPADHDGMRELSDYRETSVAVEENKEVLKQEILFDVSPTNLIPAKPTTPVSLPLRSSSLYQRKPLPDPESSPNVSFTSPRLLPIPPSMVQRVPFDAGAGYVSEEENYTHTLNQGGDTLAQNPSHPTLVDDIVHPSSRSEDSALSETPLATLPSIPGPIPTRSPSPSPEVILS